MRMTARLLTLSLLGAAPVTGPALAQEVYAYPNKGQSQAQQSNDRAACNTWAVQQTGYNPAQQAATAPPPAEPAQGGLFRGAARGAAVGAVGGAIGGNAGKGAAIGAATGGLIGGMRRREQVTRQAYAAQTQASADATRRSEYDRALTACLQARGYTVN